MIRVTIPLVGLSPHLAVRVEPEAWMAYSFDAAPYTTQHTRFPFRALLLGQAFHVRRSDVNETALRVRAAQVGRELGRKFAVHCWPDGERIECGRIG